MCSPFFLLPVTKRRANNQQEITISDKIKSIREKQQVFDWRDASDEMLWNALNNSGNSLAVGFKPADAKNEDAATNF